MNSQTESICYFQIRLLTFHLFLFLYFKASNQYYSIPFHYILFRSFFLFKYISFYSISFYYLMIISFYSISFPYELSNGAWKLKITWLNWLLLNLSTKFTMIPKGKDWDHIFATNNKKKKNICRVVRSISLTVELIHTWLVETWELRSNKVSVNSNSFWLFFCIFNFLVLLSVSVELFTPR